MKEDFENLSFEESEMEVRLWAYIDGLQTTAEKVAVEKLIAEHKSWKAKYEELLQFNQLLHQTELEQPSLRFAKNVMEEISQHQISPATKKYINNKIIWSIAAFFIVTILSLLGYGISQSSTTSANASAAFSKVANSIDYSQFFNNDIINTFLIINIILALMLLDRFLSARQKNQTNKAV